MKCFCILSEWFMDQTFQNCLKMIFFFFHFHLLIGISEETNGTSVAKYFASYGWLDLTLYERGMEIVCLGS